MLRLGSDQSVRNRRSYPSIGFCQSRLRGERLTVAYSARVSSSRQRCTESRTLLPRRRSGRALASVSPSSSVLRPVRLEIEVASTPARAAPSVSSPLSRVLQHRHGLRQHAWRLQASAARGLKGYATESRNHDASCVPLWFLAQTPARWAAAPQTRRWSHSGIFGIIAPKIPHTFSTS